MNLSYPKRKNKNKCCPKLHLVKNILSLNESHGLYSYVSDTISKGYPFLPNITEGMSVAVWVHTPTATARRYVHTLYFVSVSILAKFDRSTWR